MQTAPGGVTDRLILLFAIGAFLKALLLLQGNRPTGVTNVPWSL